MDKKLENRKSIVTGLAPHRIYEGNKE